MSCYMHPLGCLLALKNFWNPYGKQASNCQYGVQVSNCPVLNMKSVRVNIFSHFSHNANNSAVKIQV